MLLYMITLYKNFEKTLWSSKTFTRPKDNFWSYFSRPYDISSRRVWDDRTTANMDPCCVLHAGGLVNFLK